VSTKLKVRAFAAWLVVVGAGVAWNGTFVGDDPPPPKPIPTGTVYVAVDGGTSAIPRAVYEFNPSAYGPAVYSTED
jgi:hypothetical protein